MKRTKGKEKCTTEREERNTTTSTTSKCIPIIHRWVDSKVCSLKSCSQGINITTKNRVVVLATNQKILNKKRRKQTPSSSKSKKTKGGGVESASANDEDQYFVQWNEDRNVFHSHCWQALLNEKNLNSTERQLIDSGLSTVEYFDDVSTVIETAKQFAEFWKNSFHSVIFTGAGISASAGIATYRGTDGMIFVFLFFFKFFILLSI
eukprot:TRINITY_DN6407_c0_g2_i1.p1 TRINITY_DN6407_c0_g2~~TRINITY_DN6407_c0_g2_i1.p1  ORF type:complete len:206 (+),score=43.43 TRINITY_DN6407_c0_g2_i1:90-707(+)